jgi:Ankyrin repeat
VSRDELATGGWAQLKRADCHRTARLIIDLQNHMGQTALHRASQRGYIEITVMLSHGADVNTQDNEGSPLLHLEISQTSQEAVQLLLRHGASVHRLNNRGETAPQVAAARDLRRSRGCSRCMSKARKWHRVLQNFLYVRLVSCDFFQGPMGFGKGCLGRFMMMMRPYQAKKKKNHWIYG